MSSDISLDNHLPDQFYEQYGKSAHTENIFTSFVKRFGDYKNNQIVPELASILFDNWSTIVSWMWFVIDHYDETNVIVTCKHVVENKLNNPHIALLSSNKSQEIQQILKTKGDYPLDIAFIITKDTKKKFEYIKDAINKVFSLWKENLKILKVNNKLYANELVGIYRKNNKHQEMDFRVGSATPWWVKKVLSYDTKTITTRSTHTINDIMDIIKNKNPILFEADIRCESGFSWSPVLSERWVVGMTIASSLGDNQKKWYYMPISVIIQEYKKLKELWIIKSNKT